MSTGLVIRGATVLDPVEPLRVADVRVEGDTIVGVGDVTAEPGDVTIDAAGGVVMPGLVNAHTHSGQHLDRGVAPSLPLDLWLIWVVYGGVRFSADDAYVLATAGALDMLATGCTTVLDHAWVPTDGFAEHAEAIMTAYADTGIRAGLAPMIQDRDIFESMSFEGAEGHAVPEPLAEPTEPALLVEAMRDFLDRWTGAHPRLVPLIGPSAPQRCSDALMRGLAELAGDRRALVHTHVLETRPQVLATRQRYGRSIVAELAELGLMNPRTSLAHAVWMDADEYAAVRDAGVTLIHNPVSNLRCGSGIMPLPGLLAGGVSVGLGADGAASNDDQNMFGAMKLAALVHCLTGPPNAWPTAAQIWRTCLHGAAALGLSPGRITAGARADLVVLDGARHVATDGEALIRSLVFAEHGESVRTVIVGGDVVVLDGTHQSIDVAAARRRARELQERIHAGLPARQATFDRYRDVLGAVHEHAMAAPLGIERLAPTTPAFAGGLA